MSLSIPSYVRIISILVPYYFPIMPLLCSCYVPMFSLLPRSHFPISIYLNLFIYIYMGVVQNTFSRTALNRSANRVATAVPQ